MSVWDAVIDQDAVVATLSAAAAGARSLVAGGPGGSMTHAWLLTGPPGAGRSTAARAFAAALQCTGPEPGCGECRACTTTLEGAHPDVTMVATERVIISIAEVAHLVSVAQMSPTAGAWRVILVEDADRMVEQTSNLLLKALEEPPERTVWLLCTPSPGDVLPTIRSRCRVLTLRVPSREAVADLIVRRDGVDPDSAREAAALAQCHVGLARHLARSPEARQSRADLIRDSVSARSACQAVVAAGHLVDAAKARSDASTAARDAAERAELFAMLGFAEGDRLPKEVRSQITALEENQKRRARRVQQDALDRVLIDLLSLYRDVYVTQVGAGIDLVNVDQPDLVRQIADRTSPASAMFCVDAIQAARRRLKSNVSPLLVMEALTVSLQRAGRGRAG